MKRILSGLGKSLIWGGIFALSIHSNRCAASSGASFLKIPVGARAVGMGSAFTAVADDLSAIFWNPAGLSQLQERQVTAIHNQWITDMKYDHLAYAHPTSIGAFSGSVSYLSQGDIEERGEDRKRRGSFQAADAVVHLSFSRAANARARYGVNVKYIEQKIESEKASGVAVDFGVLRQLGKRLTLGLSLQNMGPEMKFMQGSYALPSTLTAGMSSQFKWFLVGLDTRYFLREQKTSIAMGMEFQASSHLSLRSGYSAQSEGFSSRKAGAGNGIRMGLGLQVLRMRMDYAVIQQGNLGSAHEISITYKL